MLPRLSTVAIVVGLALIAGGLLKMLGESGLVSQEPNLSAVAVWSLLFLVGIFVFGWGLGKRFGPAARY